jgi:alanine dehydrogenase
MLSVGILNDYIVPLIPKKIKLLTDNNIIVYVQSNTGLNAGYSDNEYIKSGAIICNTIDEVYNNAKIIVKTSNEFEYSLITKDHIIFSLFNFTKNNFTCIPSSDILFPISEIIGEEAIIQGLKYTNLYLEKKYLKITIIGAGNIGRSAAYMAKHLGYDNILLIDNNINTLLELHKEGFKTLISTKENLEKALFESYIVIGSINNTYKLITNDMLELMPIDSIFIDVTIDQGGMTEQSYKTNLINYRHIKLYFIYNIPKHSIPRLSIQLSDIIYPYINLIATNRELN